MRKQLIFLLASLTLIFSCDGDDDSTNNTIDFGVIGTWLLTNLSVESTNDYNGDGTANPNLLVETQCSLGDQLVFNADGTGILLLDMENIQLDAQQVQNSTMYEYVFDCATTGSNQVDFTWSQEGNSITVVNFVESRTYTLNNNTLTLVENNGLEIPQIVDLGGIFGVDYIFEDATYIYAKQ